MSISGRTPLLYAQENSFDGEEDAAITSHNHVSQSFSAESGEFGGGAVISYHDISYSVKTKVRGVQTEKQIIKNLRCDIRMSFTSL